MGLEGGLGGWMKFSQASLCQITPMQNVVGAYQVALVVKNPPAKLPVLET